MEGYRITIMLPLHTHQKINNNAVILCNMYVIGHQFLG